MTGKVFNLDRARKAKAKAADRARAAANRAAFGRTRTEKASERADRGRASRLLDGARRK